MSAGPTLKSVVLDTSKLVGGETTGGKVTLTGPARPGGASVALQSASPSVSCPPAVVVPAGAIASAFGLASAVVSVPTTADLTASYDGTLCSAPLELLPAVAVVAVAFLPPSVRGGTPTQAIITLDGPAPAGGVVLELDSTSASVLPPPTATVASGEKTATIAVSTAPVGAEVHAALFATYGDSSARGPVVVQPPQPASLTVAPASIVAGGRGTGAVTLDGPAPTAGFAVTLTSSSAAAVVPAAVVVPGGTTSVGFAVSTNGVASEEQVNLGAGSAAAKLTVEPASLAGFSVPSPLATASLAGTVTLDGLAQPGGAAVSLTSSDAALTPPPTVTVPEGQATTPFTVAAKAVAARTTATITATYRGASRSIQVTVDPAISAVTFDRNSVVGPSQVTLTVALAGTAPEGGATVTVSHMTGPIWDGSPDDCPDFRFDIPIPRTVVVPAGRTSAQITIPLDLPDPVFRGYYVYVWAEFEGTRTPSTPTQLWVTRS